MVVLLRPLPSCVATGGAPTTCSTNGVASFRAPDRRADSRFELVCPDGGCTFSAEPSRRNGNSSHNSSVSAQRRGGSKSVGTGSRAPLEVELDAYNSGVDEEKLYCDVIQNLRRAPQAENQDEAVNDARMDDGVVGADKDLAAVEWDPLKPHMEEGTIFASMSECRNALVTYYIKPVAATDDENDDQQPVASDEDFDEVPNYDVQQPHDFDDDPKYPPNDDSSEAPNGDRSEAPNGDPSEAPNDDPSEAPNDDQPFVVVSCAKFEEDAQGTDNQEEKRTSNENNEHKVHEEQSDDKKLKDQTEAPMLFMNNYKKYMNNVAFLLNDVGPMLELCLNDVGPMLELQM
ncbi:hypothetical protein D1007_43005 [Hordeum vulgare]|nr:hypothetical protein D1007_43005 [Hordeum vulgare]